MLATFTSGSVVPWKHCRAFRVYVGRSIILSSNDLSLFVGKLNTFAKYVFIA